ncbi:4a-hydroxytetrahydrobiopterin dehydratase [Kribbella karoonensis]|uniref:Putative pterin-4-alpha-carbinolamine dehydratase n=2 Tax=Kribbellaceae TaxID=2726069 RepID=A0ABP4PPY1_9ACTN
MPYSDCMADLLTDDQIDVALRDHLPNWKVVDNELVRSVKRDNFLDGIRLVATVAQLAESMNHHPDIDIRYTTITFRVSSHEAGGITDDDLVLARHIDTAAG